MATALPHLDDFVEGHSVEALERLAAVISGRSARQIDRSRTLPLQST
jgi:uncharacterized protein with von Willebrand factor type A (vWA) domain